MIKLALNLHCRRNNSAVWEYVEKIVRLQMDFLAHTLQLLPNLPVVGFASLTATRQISATAVVTRIKNFMSEEEN